MTARSRPFGCAPSLLLFFALCFLFPLLATVHAAVPDPSSPDDAFCQEHPIVCPSAPLFHTPAPPTFAVEFTTDRGVFTVHVVRQWAPHGADRFYALVQSNFYDANVFYRVLPGFVVQFGTSGNPAVSYTWRYEHDAQFHTVLPDDPIDPGVSNVRGYVAYSCEYDRMRNVAINRTTELFINYGNNSRLDAYNFAPFGYVTEDDMTRVVDQLMPSGEMQEVCQDPSFHKSNCTGPWLSRIYNEGNSYLASSFPQLNRIVTARVRGTEPPASSCNSCDNDGSSRSTVRNVAVGLGIVLFMTVASFVGFVFWSSSRRRRLIAEGHQPIG